MMISRSSLRASDADGFLIFLDFLDFSTFPLLIFKNSFLGGSFPAGGTPDDVDLDGLGGWAVECWVVVVDCWAG